MSILTQATDVSVRRPATAFEERYLVFHHSPPPAPSRIARQAQRFRGEEHWDYWISTFELRHELGKNPISWGALEINGHRNASDGPSLTATIEPHHAERFKASMHQLLALVATLEIEPRSSVTLYRETPDAPWTTTKPTPPAAPVSPKTKRRRF